MPCIASIFLVVLKMFIRIISLVVFIIEKGTISLGILYVKHFPRLFCYGYFFKYLLNEYIPIGYVMNIFSVQFYV